MQSRINFAMISLAVLWIVTGAFGLSILGATSVHPSADPRARVHSVDCGPQRTLQVECEPHPQATVSSADPRI